MLNQWMAQIFREGRRILKFQGSGGLIITNFSDWEGEEEEGEEEEGGRERERERQEIEY